VPARCGKLREADDCAPKAVSRVLLALLILLVSLVLLVVTVWNVLAWRQVRVSHKVSVPLDSISILIPARNEEENIAACLDAALAQPANLCEVLVYDDHSSDATRKIVDGFASRDPRVQLIEPAPLPAGWCGKTFACARLAERARGRWLLFLDADARLGEGASAEILREAESAGVTLLSCWPRLEMRSFWECLLMPLLNFLVFTLYPAPLAARRRLDPSLGLAHGACLLAREDVYKLVGGHTAVRAELFEDVRLSQVWRAKGHHSLCLDGQQVVSVRMYDSLGQIWQGFQKNFFPAFRRESSFWFFMGVHLVVLQLPLVLAPLALVLPIGITLVLAAGSVLAMRAALAVRFRHPLWSVLLHPVAEAFLIALGLTSWLKCKTGRGVEWKGRRYASRAAGNGVLDPFHRAGAQKGEREG